MPPAGYFVDQDGRVLGRHDGIHHFTIGQRKGLKTGFGKPMYVCGIRPESNEVVLGTNEDTYDLDGGYLRCRFIEKVRAVTPGQAIVFYQDGVVLGGGTIIRNREQERNC